MKRFIIIVAAALFPLAMSAQAQINTKKAIVADFPSKITKVVLTGNGIFDAAYVVAVKDCWQLSPYEFCSLDEFRTLMESDEYYFLLVTDTKFRKEETPGLKTLTLIKGGKRAEKGLGKMYEVVSVPLCSADDPSGRELVFLPALVGIVQDHVEAAMRTDFKGYGGLGAVARNIDGNARIVFAKSDVSFDNVPSQERAVVLDDDEVDGMFADGAENTVVSYSVFPAGKGAGSYCYNMLFYAKGHKLCYYRRYRLTAGSGAGFNAEDLNRIL